jgi:hypothetical protein
MGPDRLEPRSAIELAMIGSEGGLGRLGKAPRLSASRSRDAPSVVHSVWGHDLCVRIVYYVVLSNDH